jgi:Whi5 like
MVTEPDEARAGAMRGDDLRQVCWLSLSVKDSADTKQKARELKLRLSLAQYKVQTNQIDTPMSQLQIKTTSQPAELTTVPRLANAPRSGPFSSIRPSKIPNLKPRAPNDEYTRSFSSSPPPYLELESCNEPEDRPRDCVSTPLLPRQRQSLLNPPSLGGDFEDRSPARELTSSVVKGRAAKGLLSLMGHQS